MPQRPLSELECFVLGIIWKYGPCTAYAVRQQLQSSPSTQWSGSAGSVYPLVRRLQRAGLLRGRPAARGRRASLEYSITPAGVSEIRRWIGPPLPAEAVTVAHDPIRSRLRFLSVLPPDQQAHWIRAALKALDDVAQRVSQWQALHTNDPDPFTAVVTRSGLLDLRGRKAWLGEALRVAGQEGKIPASINKRNRN